MTLMNKNNIAKKKKHTKFPGKQETVLMLSEGLAHDLNNIMGGIVSYLSILKAKTRAGSDSLREIENIEEATARAGRLVEQLLAFADCRPSSTREVNLNEEILRYLTRLKAAVRKDTVIETNLREYLPPVNADSDSIRQILLNLTISAAAICPSWIFTIRQKRLS